MIGQDAEFITGVVVSVGLRQRTIKLNTPQSEQSFPLQSGGFSSGMHPRLPYAGGE